MSASLVGSEMCIRDSPIVRGLPCMRRARCLPRVGRRRGGGRGHRSKRGGRKGGIPKLAGC
eukprot:12082218-Alexandrium_andersonii.AAC.1